MILILKSKMFYLYLFVLLIGFIVTILWSNFEFFLALLFTLVIAIIQLYSSLKDIKELELKNNELKEAKKQLDKYNEMGLIRVLEHRDSEDEYRSRIKIISNKLYIMGHTAKRLIEDFADYQGRPDKKVLLEALARDVEVKILIANKSYLSENKKSDFEITKEKMLKIKNQYPLKFKCAYYNHIPTHSLFLFDNECLIGPIFTDLESRDTPTLDMKYDSSYASKYIDYFNKEFENAEKL